MTPEEAYFQIRERFPFQGYMNRTQDAYLSISTAVLRHLKPGSSILDFGCGPCDKTAVLQLLGYQCAGFDDLQDEWHKVSGNREKILNFAKECGIDFRLATDFTFPFEKHTFDMVMLNDVIEHLHDSPRDLFNDLLELVKPEGYLFVSVPNAVNIRKRLDVLRGRTNLPSYDLYYWYPGSWRGHIREYTKDDLAKLSEYLNLEVAELKGCDHMIHRKLPASIRPLYIMVTGVFNDWKDSWTLVAKKRPGWQPMKTLPENKLTDIMKRYSRYYEPMAF